MTDASSCQTTVSRARSTASTFSSLHNAAVVTTFVAAMHPPLAHLMAHTTCPIWPCPRAHSTSTGRTPGCVNIRMERGIGVQLLLRERIRLEPLVRCVHQHVADSHRVRHWHAPEGQPCSKSLPGDACIFSQQAKPDSRYLLCTLRRVYSTCVDRAPQVVGRDMQSSMHAPALVGIAKVSQRAISEGVELLDPPSSFYSKFLIRATEVL